MEKKINYTTFLCMIILNLLFFSCNSSTNENNSEDSQYNENNDTTTVRSGELNDTTPKLHHDKIAGFAKANFSHKDSARYFIPHSNVYPMIMSGNDFSAAYEEMANKDYIYLYFLFSSGDPKITVAEGLDENHTTYPITLIAKPRSIPLSPNGPVRNNRYWARPSILYEEDAKTFLNNLKAEGVNLVDDGEKFQVIITPSVETDLTDPNRSQYIQLTLSVKQIRATSGRPNTEKPIMSRQATNPCPTCRQ